MPLLETSSSNWNDQMIIDASYYVQSVSASVRDVESALSSPAAPLGSSFSWPANSHVFARFGGVRDTQSPSVQVFTKEHLTVLDKRLSNFLVNELKWVDRQSG